MKTLRLFDAVIAKESNISKSYISDNGVIIDPSAMWAKDAILKYYSNELLFGGDLNKTFHKSWAKIKNSTRFELYVDQILHYISTYGSNFQSEVYIPDEVLDIPDTNLVFKVVKGYSIDELQNKCLSMLSSGIALQEDTINDLLSILIDELGYKFTGKERIRNKEAQIKLADIYNIIPTDVMEFFRIVIYKATGKSLLIKNPGMVATIKQSNYNPVAMFNQFGLERLAEIFYRFKPLFLAFKNKCPKTINKISKLAKKYHKPLVINPLNEVTVRLLTDNDLHWLDSATPFALFKAISACYKRLNNQKDFLYRVRNGKSYVAKNEKYDATISSSNFNFLLGYMNVKYNLRDKKVYIPANIEFGLPTSEKMFVGNIPVGTKIHAEKMVVGIYWENSWGAYDLDLSGITLSGDKVGWNSYYNHDDGELMYSGDMTSAPNGAVEYLYASKGLCEPVIVLCNIFSGNVGCKYKIIVGSGDNISREYMMNPNNLIFEVSTNTVQAQTIMGIFIQEPEKDAQSFVVLNTGLGNMRVSNSKHTNKAINALYQEYANPLTFNAVITMLGAILVNTKENVDYDLSLDKLEKDSFMRIIASSHGLAKRKN